VLKNFRVKKFKNSLLKILFPSFVATILDLNFTIHITTWSTIWRKIHEFIRMTTRIRGCIRQIIIQQARAIIVAIRFTVFRQLTGISEICIFRIFIIEIYRYSRNKI